MRKKKHYINNKDLYEAIRDYQIKVKSYNARLEEFESGQTNGIKPRPPEMSDYIGSCFMMLSKKIASRGNFCSYTYRDEMEDDGIENCIMAIKSFDTEKWDNPYSYFTKVIWWAFLRRIEKEKKQSYIKHMSLVNASMEDLAHGGSEFHDIRNMIDDEKAASYVTKFEKKKKVKA